MTVFVPFFSVVPSFPYFHPSAANMEAIIIAFIVISTVFGFTAAICALMTEKHDSRRTHKVWVRQRVR